MEQKPIDAVEKLVDFVCEAGNAVGMSLADDGKIGMSDLPKLMPALMAVGGLLGALSALPEQMKDIDQAEAASLVERMKAKLDLPQEKVEAIIENALEVGLKIKAVVELIKK